MAATSPLQSGGTDAQVVRRLSQPHAKLGLFYTPHVSTGLSQTVRDQCICEPPCQVRPTALARQDLSFRYLAHHELENVLFITIVVVIIIIISSTIIIVMIITIIIVMIIKIIVIVIIITTITITVITIQDLGTS